MKYNRATVEFFVLSISLMLGMMGCATSTSTGQSELLSDGYISYIEDSISYIAHDSLIAGDPSNFTLSGMYDYEDSLLSFSGGGASIWISQCRDTGIYVLSISSGLVGQRTFAAVGNYITDSLHKGQFHLTRLDTVAGRIAGTFSFAGRKYNGSEPDTVIISNGVVFDFPIAH